MTTKNRMSFAAGIAAVAVAAVVGCSHADTQTSTATSTSVQTPSASIQPAATSSATPTTTSKYVPKPKTVDVTVVPEGDTTIALGGPPIRFSVTITNNGPDIAKAGLVVSLGHCSCGIPGASMMAKGTMHMLDPQTNEWVEVPFVREGTGMDYILQNLVPPFQFTHGQTLTYRLEMALDPDQDGITDGETSIGATVTNADTAIEGDPFGAGSYDPITVRVS